MKKVLFAFAYYLLNEWLMYVPFHAFRRFFLNFFIGNIGTDSSVLMGTELRKGKNVFIGNNSTVNQKVLLDGRGGKLTIGSNVDIAQETNIWTLEHDVHSNDYIQVGDDVTIEDYVWVSSRVTILPGVRIGRGAVVASGSVVTKDVPPMVIVGGIPARKIGERHSDLSYKIVYKPWFR